MISVVLLCYNQERFIGAALRSILEQEGPSLDIVVSDDHSTDATFEIIQKIVSEYKGPHTVLISQNEHNLGLGANFLKAVKLTKGDWVIAAAGDDVSEKNRAIRIAQIIEANPALRAVCSTFYYIDEKGEKSGAPGREHVSRWQSAQAASFDCLASQLMSVAPSFGIMGATAAWHRSLFENFPDFDKSLVIDEGKVLAWRAKMLGETLFVDEHLVGYRRHPEALSFASNMNRSFSKKIVSEGIYREKSQRWKIRVRDSGKQTLLDVQYAGQHGLISLESATNALRMFKQLDAFNEAECNFASASCWRRFLMVLRFWRFRQKRIGFRRIFTE